MEYKVNTLLPIQFEVIENPPYLNDSRYQAVKVYIAHEKENYNGSYFDISVLQKMGQKMAGVPIVGYITADNANKLDFNGHEQRLVIQDGEVSIEYLGRAFGCILSNDDVSFVDRQHEDGSIRKYLCATGVLWKMFTDCVDIFDRDNQKGHSMELQEDSIKGNFEKDGYYHFTDATVRALCILGDGVLPAMSNSVIEKFSIVDCQSQVQELLTEINESIKQYTKNQVKINSYWIEKEKAKQLVDKTSEIFNKLGFECIEWIVDGKECQVTGVINKVINKEATKNWGFDIYDKDTITLHSNNLDNLDISTISISSVDLLLKNKESSVQNFSLSLKLDDANFNIDFSEKEDKKLDEKQKLIAKYNLTVEQLDFSIEEISLEELETKLQEFSNEPESDPEPIVSFSATYNQKREALRNALDPIIVKDEEGKITEETYFYVSDFDNEFVYVEKDYWSANNYECTNGRVKYTFDETTITATVDMSSWENMIRVWLTEAENQVIQDERNNASAEYQKLKDEFEEYKTNYSTENSEVERLQQFEKDTLVEVRKEAEESLFSQFDEKLKGVEEYEKLKETASQFKIEDLTKECYVILGMKSANFSAKPKNKNDKVRLDFGKVDVKTNDVDEFIEKYSKR